MPLPLHFHNLIVRGVHTILGIPLLVISSFLPNPTLYWDWKLVNCTSPELLTSWCLPSLLMGSQEKLKSHNVLSCALALAALVCQHSWIGVVMGQSQQHPAVGGTSHAGTVAIMRQQLLNACRAAVAAVGPSEEGLRVQVIPIPAVLLQPKGLQ